ncbi:hypothetical protein LP085_30720 [Achromobacter sp. MY14]|uniref:hypothetical protein n=1 Tax=unclassified Achromobacter TaxID=2626865 RepID=UPI001E3A8F08|nr:hypothetical protein [Achromobacter sp. MY14]MCD0501258.1 hypothetical protein [Achromobacter sp. MY14]
MYNFLVTGRDITAPSGSIELPSDRVFKHTEPHLEQRYFSDNTLDTKALCLLPTIIANESSSDPQFPSAARIGTIVRVTSSLGSHKIEYEIDERIQPIPNAVLESLASELRFVIGGRGFDDFQTNHWAIKDADLFRVLFTHRLGQIRPRVFQLPDCVNDLGMVALMMPFDANFDSVTATLQSTVSQFDMQCIRADDIWHDDVIVNDVVKLIATARVVICDLSGKNANVFYEAGIAHTLGKDVILIAQQEFDIPFDLRHLRYIRYRPTEDGLGELSQKVKRRLEELRRS